MVDASTRRGPFWGRLRSTQAGTTAATIGTHTRKLSMKSELALFRWCLLVTGTRRCGRMNRWLRDFLAEKLGAAPMEDTRQNSTLDANYPGAARIAHVGAQAWRYDDLTLLVTGAPQDERTQDYRDKFMKGEAKHYHMRLWASTRENVEETVMQEIRYCAVTYWSEKHMRAAEYVYPVKSVSKQKRSDINAEQAGLERKGNHELYWLFELGESRKLERPIIHPLQRGHFMKLTSLAALDTKADWDSLPDRYAFIRTLRKD